MVMVGVMVRVMVRVGAYIIFGDSIEHKASLVLGFDLISSP